MTACRECDTLLTIDLKDEHRFECPTCGGTLTQPSFKNIQHCIALSLTCLILMIPAISMPLISFHISEFATVSTIISGIHKVWQNGYILMSVAVSFSTIFVPAFISLAILIVSLRVMSGNFRGLKRILHSYHHLEEWALLEVYMLGIIVAYFKLKDFGEVEIDTGLFSFVLLMLCLLVATKKFDSVMIWELIERDEKQRES